MFLSLISVFFSCVRRFSRGFLWVPLVCSKTKQTPVDFILSEHGVCVFTIRINPKEGFRFLFSNHWAGKQIVRVLRDLPPNGIWDPEKRHTCAHNTLQKDVLKSVSTSFGHDVGKRLHPPPPRHVFWLLSCRPQWEDHD